MTTLSKRPNMIRREVVVQDPKGANHKIVTGFDGTTVWALNPIVGGQPQEITGAAATAAREDAEFDSVFVDYKLKGHTVELVGTEMLNGRSVHHLKLTKKNGKVQHHYIDAENGLERRVVTTLDVGGKKAEVAMDLSDHKEVDGLTVPFSMRQSVNGVPASQIVIEKVEFNVPIDDAVFKMPK